MSTTHDEFCALKGWCVYLLRDINRDLSETPTRGSRALYVGMTNSFRTRLQHHNSKQVRSTRHTTWIVLAVAPLENRSQAAVLEAWLKTGNTTAKRNDFLHAYGTITSHRTPLQQALLNRAAVWHAQRQVAHQIEQGNIFHPNVVSRTKG